LHRLIENLLTQNISPGNIFFFNCDNIVVQSLFESVTSFVQFIRQYATDSRSYIFIDEIQRLSNPGMFLKELFDLKLNFKIFVSGSSSLEIRSKIKEALTGRKILFHVLPFDFAEYLATNESLSPLNTIPPKEVIDTYEHFDRVWGGKLKTELEQFLIYGGYPRILLTNEIEKKKLLLNEIFTSYVKKDISEFLKIENIAGFNKLVQIISFTSGQIINKSTLALKAGIHNQTLDKFLHILQETFIIEIVIPFFSNKLKEIVKNPKLYFIDPGIRNFAISNFNALSLRPDQGFLQENFILRELKSLFNNNFKLKFWRTKVGAEIDFIIDRGDKVIPIECKSLLKKPGISRSFQNYISYYHPSKGLVLNSQIFDKISFEEAEIYFIPYHWFHILKHYFLRE